MPPAAPQPEKAQTQEKVEEEPKEKELSFKEKLLNPYSQFAQVIHNLQSLISLDIKKSRSMKVRKINAFMDRLY